MKLPVPMYVCSAGLAEVGPMLLLFFPSLILKIWGNFLFQLFWGFIFSFPGYFGNTCLAPSPSGFVLREGTAAECDSLCVAPHLGTRLHFSLDELLRGSSGAHRWDGPGNHLSLTSLVTLGLIPATATGLSHPLSCSFPEVSLSPAAGGALVVFLLSSQNLFGAVPGISLVLEDRAGAQAVFVIPVLTSHPGHPAVHFCTPGNLSLQQSLGCPAPTGLAGGWGSPKNLMNAQHQRISQNHKLPSADCYEPGCSRCDLKWFHAQVQVFFLSFPSFPSDQVHS